MKRIYTLLVAAMAAVCGAWADDVIITEVNFTLPVDEIEYRKGVSEKIVMNNIRMKITSETSDKYAISKNNCFLLYYNSGASFVGIGNGETPIGSRTGFYENKEQYYLQVFFYAKSKTISFTSETSALIVTYNGAVITPTKVESEGQYLRVYIPLGEPAAAAETLYTLTCVNATPKSYPYQTFAGGDYEEGSSVTFRAKSPNTGELFDHWEATGITLTEEQKTAELLTITMPANAVTITAVYKKIDYKIIIADDIENGTVTAAATANYGDEVELTITPATGYELDVLSVKDADNNDVTVSADYKFEMPASNVTVTATFKAVTPTALQNAELMGIYTENGRIICAQEFQIFTITGQNVTEMNGSLCGVYIVKVGDKAQKVVVK